VYPMRRVRVVHSLVNANLSQASVTLNHWRARAESVLLIFWLYYFLLYLFCN